MGLEAGADALDERRQEEQAALRAARAAAAGGGSGRRPAGEPRVLCGRADGEKAGALASRRSGSGLETAAETEAKTRSSSGGSEAAHWAT